MFVKLTGPNSNKYAKKRKSDQTYSTWVLFLLTHIKINRLNFLTVRNSSQVDESHVGATILQTTQRTQIAVV